MEFSEIIRSQGSLAENVELLGIATREPKGSETRIYMTDSQEEHYYESRIPLFQENRAMTWHHWNRLIDLADDFGGTWKTFYDDEGEYWLFCEKAKKD